jgi:hypothetical protein
MGPAFSWREAQRFVQRLARWPHEVHRFGQFHVYARIVRPAARAD